MANITLPVPSVPIIRPGGQPVLVEKPWYDLLVGLARAHNALANDTTPIDLATGVDGVLPVANGGTGRASPNAYQLWAGGTTGTGNFQQIAPGNAGELLLSQGASALPAFDTLTVTDSRSGVIEYPSAKNYVVWIKVPFDLTVVSMTTKSSRGTCRLTAKINSTAITGLANSVSTSEVTNTATAANTASAGDDIVLTVSSLSGAQDVSFTINFERVLPA